MNLVDEIIDELASTEKSLANPFLRTKILASRIGYKDLLAWTTNELSGYLHNDTPDYRIAKPVITCTLTDGYNINQNTPLPLTILDKAFADEIVKHRLNESVGTLEEIRRTNQDGLIVKAISEDLAGILSRSIQEKGKQIWITNIVITTSIVQVTEVLSRIRSLLLDFMLQLEADIPNLENIIKDKLMTKEKITEKVEHIYNQTIINASGSGNTISSGNYNKINATVTITKGDIDQLQQQLKKNNVSNEDIHEIVDLVQREQPVSTEVFGKKVNGWLGRMYAKTLDGSWQVATGTAAGILVEFIKQYYGMH
jgi:hypothetical protein